MPKSFFRHRKDPKPIRRLKPSQWQNRRREALTKLVSKSITSCASHDVRIDHSVPMIAICSRNVRDVSGIIVTNIIEHTFLKRYLAENVSNVSESNLFRHLANYSQSCFENINIKLKEWMNSENFVKDFGFDYYHSCENYENFTIGYDRNGGYSHYYKYECSKFKNELQWFFSLYDQWNSVVRCVESPYYLMKISDWFKAEKRDCPTPLPSKKGVRWFKVDDLLRCVYNNIIEKYETDLNPQSKILEVAFSNYFSTLWLNTELRRISAHTQSISCITEYFPFPDQIVTTRNRYLRLLSLGGIMRTLIKNMTQLPGTSLTMTRFAKRTLVNYLTSGEYFIILEQNGIQFPQLWARRWKR
jgi:hypothetical protein